MNVDIKKPGDTPEARVAWFCARYNVEAPTLEYDTEPPTENALLLTAELTTWCHLHGVNLDWLCFGDVRALVDDYRDREMAKQSAREFAKLTDQMKPEIKEGLITTVTAVVRHGLPMKEALDAFNQVAEEHRGKAAA